MSLAYMDRIKITNPYADTYTVSKEKKITDRFGLIKFSLRFDFS